MFEKLLVFDYYCHLNISAGLIVFNMSNMSIFSYIDNED